MSNIEEMLPRLRELEKVAIDQKTDGLARDRVTNERLDIMFKMQRGER